MTQEGETRLVAAEEGCEAWASVHLVVSSCGRAEALSC